MVEEEVVEPEAVAAEADESAVLDHSSTAGPTVSADMQVQSAPIGTLATTMQSRTTTS